MKVKSASYARSVAVPPHHLGLRQRAGNSSLVGVTPRGYAMEKLTYGLPAGRYRYCQVYHPPVHRLVKRGNFWNQTPLILDNSLRLLHTLNLLPVGRQPFIVSFENRMPRYLHQPQPWMMKVGLKILSSARCRKLLALSEMAAVVARKRFAQWGLPEVAAKVAVFRGGLKLPGEDLPPDRPVDGGGPLRVLLVGRDGFRQGLVPAVRAVEKARKGGLQVELTVVSALESMKYALKEFTPSRSSWLQKLQRMPFVDHHLSLPNLQVRQAMRNHDILLLPTFDETLGWVVVEAGLEGTSALVTNVFALPELVENGVSGAMLELELGDESRWCGIWLKGEELGEAVRQAEQQMEQGIIKVLEKLCRDRQLSRHWGRAAKKRITSMYHPQQAASALELFYDEALER